VTPADRVAALESEFERLKERADKLDRILAGSEDEWLGIQEKLGGTVAEVTINAPLAEARQTALAMATINKTLESLGVGQEASTATEDPADALARRRKEKQEEAARGLAQAH
jgi:hypothetical protein